MPLDFFAPSTLAFAGVFFFFFGFRFFGFLIIPDLSKENLFNLTHGRIPSVSEE